VIKKVSNGFKTALVSTREHMGKLFKEFEQINMGIRKICGGTGLELAISKKLVGGTIMRRVNSRGVPLNYVKRRKLNDKCIGGGG